MQLSNLTSHGYVLNCMAMLRYNLPVEPEGANWLLQSSTGGQNPTLEFRFTMTALLVLLLELILQNNNYNKADNKYKPDKSSDV